MGDDATKRKIDGGDDNLITIKKVFAFIITLIFVGSVEANPVLDNVAHGNVQVQQSPGNTQVQQNSQQAIINWHSFNIGAGERTHFQQPAGGTALNRINPNQGVSQIFGHLSATGKIILVNQAGIFFGSSAVVDVGGIIASTSDISNENFLAGKYIFDRPGTGAVINQGTIRAAEHGLVALIGNNVANDGTITAKGGHVVLASGTKFTVNLSGDNLIHFAVDEGSTSASVGPDGKKMTSGVSNRGIVVADGGRVIMTAKAASGVLDRVINMEGVAQARSVHQVRGEIILAGEGAPIRVAGKIDVSGKAVGQRGGKVKIMSKRIIVDKGSKIDASGDAGGGEILIGGDYQGKTPVTIFNGQQVLANSQVTLIMPEAEVNADAITSGNGGKIIAWGDDATGAYGKLSARGGAISGDGGFIETSAHYLETAGIQVDLSAPYGKSGSWLLDPYNLTISTGASSPSLLKSGTVLTTFQTYRANADSSILNTTDLVNALGNASVTVITDNSTAGTELGNITVANLISWGNNNSLTLSAYRHIILSANIENTAVNSSANINLRADNTGTGVGKVCGSGSALCGGSPTGVVSYTGGGTTTGTISVYYNPNTFGTPETPYSGGSAHTDYMLVNNNTNLQNINSFSSQNFALGKNLDLTGVTWTPIGTYSGKFDGLGNTINNLTLNSATSPVGFFSNVTGSVTRLGLVNANVTNAGGTNSSTGLLVGFLNGGSVSNSFSTGSLSVSGATGNVVGGLIGQVAGAGTVSNSYSSASVAGNFTGSGNFLGGLIGFTPNASTAVISNNYATGAISSAGTGGAGTTSGGFVGSLGGSGTISTSYSSGTVTGLGTLNGFGQGAGTFTNDFYDSTIVPGGSSKGTGLSTANSLLAASYTGFSITQLFAAGNTSTPWYIKDNNTRPILGAEYSTTLNTAHQLQLIAKDATALSESYQMKSAISASGTGTAQTSDVWAGSSAKGFVPIGTSASPFLGRFSGGSNAISNLYISNNDTTTSLFLGLFGFVGDGSYTGSISDLTLSSPTVLATFSPSSGQVNLMGALAGYVTSSAASNTVLNNITVTNPDVHMTSGFNTSNRVGGVVGEIFTATANNLTVTGGTVNSQNSFQFPYGGIAGVLNNGTISNSTNSATVTANGLGRGGGIVGLLTSGTISSSSNSGLVRAEINLNGGNQGDSAGGIAGLVSGGSNTISSSYNTGTIGDSSTAWVRAGGLVGQLIGGGSLTINGSFNMGSIGGSTFTQAIGGLVGYVSATPLTIQSGSFNLGTVTGTNAINSAGANSVGGLVGYITNGATNAAHIIQTSYNGGTVSVSNTSTNASYAGGLLGNFDSSSAGSVSILNTYNYGTVTGAATNGNAGGLIGGTGFTASIGSSWNSGPVSGGANNAALVGNVSAGTTTANNDYWDFQTTGIGSSGSTTGAANTSGTGTFTNAGSTSLGQTTAWFLTTSNFTPAGTGSNQWDISTSTGHTWYQINGSTRPFLQAEANNTITTSHQLQLMGLNLSNSYTLRNNIDLTNTKTSSPTTAQTADIWGGASGKGWVPVGTTSGATAFVGSLNGQNFTVSNLNIPTSNISANVGLFGYVGSGSYTGVIQNVGLVSPTISVTTNGAAIGALAGTVQSSAASNVVLSNVYTSGGSVTGSTGGNEYIGGLVGILTTATMSGSYNSGTAVTIAGGYSGGLIGQMNSGILTNSFNTGTLNFTATSESSGGLIGAMYGTAPQLLNSYNLGTINMNGANFAHVGGLVGTLGWTFTGLTLTPSATLNTIANSFNAGVLTGSVSNIIAGGLIGSSDTTTNAAKITDVANYGGLVQTSGSNNSFGGLIGLMSSGNVNIQSSINTGAVSTGAQVGGIMANNQSSTSSFGNLYWDTQTSGTSSAQGAGNAVTASGVTTTTLQSALQSGFGSNWSIIGGTSYPYLNTFYTTTPRVISGNATGAAKGVSVIANGVAPTTTALTSVGISNALSGANNYYYFLQGNGVVANNSDIITYMTTGTGANAVALVPNSTASVTSLNMTANTVTVGTSTGSSTAANMSNSDLITALGAFSSGNILFTNPSSTNIQTNSGISFLETVDITNYNLNGNITAQGSGNITFNGPITVTATAALSATDINTPTTGTINTNGNALTLTNLSSTIANSILAGNISGSGSVTKSGTGGLAFTGTNNYSGGTTISAGTLQLGNSTTTGSVTGNIINNSALRFLRTDTPTFSNVISGSGTVTQAGSGTVTLSGANTYTGATTISAGILSVSSLANGGSASNIGQSTNAAANLVLDGGTLQYTGANTSIDRNFTLAAGKTSSIDLTNNLTISGASASTTGALTKIGNGILTFTGANAHTGDNTISAGTLQLGNATATGSVIGNIINNAALIFNRTDTPTFSNVISGSGTVTQAGSGTLTLSGANSYTGVTTISAGILSISSFVNGGSNSNIGASTNTATNLILNGGTLRYTGGAQSTDRLFSVGTSGGTIDSSGSGALTFSNSGAIGFNGQTGARTLSLIGSNTGTLTPVFGDNSGVSALIKNGTGTWILSGANNYSGTTTISGGTLQASNASALGTTAAGTTVASGATLNLAGSVNIGAEALSISGDGVGSAGVLTGVGSTSGAITLLGDSTIGLSGDLTGAIGELGGSFGFTKIGSLLALFGNNTFTGAVTVNNGAALAASHANALGTIAAGTTVLSGGNLRIVGTNITLPEALTLSGDGTGSGAFLVFGTGNAVSGAITLAADSSIGSSNVTYTISGDIGQSGTRALTKLGTGTMILTGGNSYTNTVISDGVLQIGNGTTGTLGSGTVSNNAALVFNRSNALTVANTISGTGSLTQSGSGNLTLQGSNTYTGKTFINAGTVSIAAQNNLGGNPSSFTADQITLNGGTLATTASINLNDSNRGVTLGAGGGIFDVASSTTLTLPNVIAGAGNLTKANTGTIVLTNSNSYTGKSIINAGTLSIASQNNLGGNPSSFTADQITLNGGTLATTASINLNDSNRGVTLGAGGGIFDVASSTTLTLPNVIAGAGNLTKANTGTMVLAGTNSYTGKSIINAGTLSISAENNLGGNPSSSTADQLTINGGTLATTASFSLDDSNRGVTLGASGGTFNVAGSTTLTLPNVIAGSGALTKSSGGTLTNSNTANTYTGATIVSEGILSAVTIASSGSNSSIGAGSAITLGGASTAGTLSYTSNTSPILDRTITVGAGGGTFQTTQNGVVTLTGAVSAGGNLTFDILGSGVINQTAGGITGGGGLIKNSSGLLTLSAANTYTGATAVNGGILRLNNASAIGDGATNSSAVNVGSGGQLNVRATLANTGATFTLNGAGGGAGALSFTGTGLTLSNPITLASDSVIQNNVNSNTLAGTINGGFGLTLQGAGTLVIGNTIGAGTALASIGSSIANLTFNNGTVTSTGSQNFNSAVSLGANSVFTTTNSGVTFGSTVDGAQSLQVAAGNGAVNFSGAVGLGTALTNLSSTGSGTVTFGAAVGDASHRLTSVALTGASNLNGGSIFTSGNQTYTGAVTLGVGTTMNSSTGTLSLPSISGATNALTLSGAIVNFGNTVSGVTNLDVTGTTNINTTGITTSGTQSFHSAVNLGANTVLTTTNSIVTFDSTINGAQSLQVAAGNAAVNFGGAIGLSTAPTALSSVGSGLVTFTGAVGDGLHRLTSLALSGAANLNGGSVFTSGAQTYSGTATLGASTTLNSSGGALNLATVAGGTNALTLSGSSVNFVNTVGGVSNLDVTGTTNINTTGITTSGTQSYHNAVNLGANTVLTTTDSIVTFDSTINGAQSLQVAAGNAAVNFGGAIGLSTAPTALSSVGSGLVTFTGAVGDGLHRLTSLALSGAANLNGGSVFTSGAQTYSGTATLGASTTLNSSGGALNLATVAGGTNALTLSGSSVNFGNTVGGVSNLDVTGTTNINTTGITTSGTQSYHNAVNLGANTVLTTTNNIVTFDSTINGAQSLQVAAGNAAVNFGGAIGLSTAPTALSSVGSGLVTFTGAVGDSLHRLTSLALSGAANLNGGSVFTSGAQTYSGTSTLGASTTLNSSGGALNLATVAGGGNALTLSGSTVNFGNTVSGVTNLGVTGVNAININTTGITTTGTQDYTGALILGASPTLKSGSSAITINGAVSGSGQTLSLQDASSTGAVTFNNAITLDGLTTFGGNYNVSLAGGSSTSSTISNAVNFLNTGALTLGNGGTLTFAGGVALTGNATNPSAVNVHGSIRTNGSELTFGAITVQGDSTLATNNSVAAGNDLTIGAITSGGNALTLNAGTGGSILVNSFSGNGDLTISNSSGTTFSNDVAADDVTLSNTTGTIAFNGALTASALNVAANGFAVQLNNGSTTTGATTFLNTGGVTLTGTNTFNGGLTSTASATTINGTVATTNNSLSLGAVTVGGATTLKSGSGAIAINGIISGSGQSLTVQDVSSTGAVTFFNNVTLGNLITSSSNYAISLLGSSNTIANATTFNNTSGVTLGNGGDIFNFTNGLTSTAGTTTLASTLNTTNAAITLGSSTLSGNTTLSSGSGAINLGVMDGQFDLVTNNSNSTTFNNSVNIASLNATASALNLNGGSITTAGNQNYNGAVNLGADTTLDSSGTNGAITFANAVDGNHALNLNSGSGTITFNGAIGASPAPSSLVSEGSGTVIFNSTVGSNTDPVGSIDIAGTTQINGGSVTTARDQIYHAVVLGNDTTLAMTDTGNISLINGVSGNKNLNLTGGSNGTSFTLGGTLALNDVTVAGSGGTNTLSLQTNDAQEWSITSTDNGNIDNVAGVANANFSDIQNLTGGTSNTNTFYFSNGLVGGTITGGSAAGTNVLDFANYTGPVDIQLSSNTSGTVSGMTFNNINKVIGDSSSLKLVPAESNSIVITGANSQGGVGFVNDPIFFDGFKTYTGTSGQDTVRFNVPFTWNNGIAVVNGVTLQFINIRLDGPIPPGPSPTPTPTPTPIPTPVVVNTLDQIITAVNVIPIEIPLLENEDLTTINAQSQFYSIEWPVKKIKVHCTEFAGSSCYVFSISSN